MTNLPGDRRPRLLFLNQYYRPGVEATATLLAELCEDLAADHDVTVVTGRLHGQPHLPTDEVLNGVRVLRTRSTAFDRTQLHRRAVNYGTFMADSLLLALGSERPDVVACLTDPPMIGDVGLLVARRFAVPLVVISEDVFPEIAVELRRLENPIVVGLLDRMVDHYLQRADRVVAIGETMRRRLAAKGVAEEHLTVIENWVDTRAIVPRPRPTAWAREQGLDGTFVVMHSGNVGHAQDLETLVRAGSFLRDLEDLRIVIIGSGARSQAVQNLARRLDVANVVFLPYQPRELLSESLSTADLHFVGLAKGLSGFVVPSRVYGIMAAGRPLLAGVDEDSETARLVEAHGCGVVVKPGRAELVAGVIRDAHADGLPLDEMGAKGRVYVEREADREVAFARYRALFREVLSSSSAR
jgi:glycosyltransferase involved in cell wall biosynthesis